MLKTIKGPVGFIITVSLFLMAFLLIMLSVNENKSDHIDIEKQHGAAIARGLANTLAPFMARELNGEQTLTPLLAGLIEYHHFIGARVYNANDELIIEQSGHRNRRFTEAFFQQYNASTMPNGTVVENDAVIVRKNIGNSLYPDGYLVLFFDIHIPVKKRLEKLLMSVALPVFGLWLLCTLASLFLVHRLLKPLTVLTQFTQAVVHKKDFALRTSVDEANEIGTLGQHINSLLAMIEVELLINHEQNQTLIDQQETMSRLANYDSLTGLPNRQFVLDNLKLELARARRNEEDLVLLFFDLDGFKGINDSLGHETGDLILIEVADRVSNLIREGDLVARLGGDEFLIVPDRAVRDTSVEHLAIRLISAFNEAFHLRGLSLTVGVSIGIAKAVDAQYDLSELMSNADLAMYRSKARGRGGYTVFTPDMVETHKRKLHLANAIEHGLKDNEFIVYYQAKVNSEGKIVGLEALIRWQHPEFGMVMPSEFIPIAEQGGKITAITQWVIEKVCADMPTLKGWLKRRFRVSINLSGHDIRNSSLFDTIYQIFTHHQINPEYVEFEVTESAYLENFALSNKFFKRMSNMGCAIALDDFGTGYSSLSYLTQISIDTLKIDKQFVRELETSERSQLVTGAIIDLAKRLSLSLCAEGIENSFQWDYLISHGCDHIQGFMFSKPVPLDEVIAMPSQFDVPKLIAQQTLPGTN